MTFQWLLNLKLRIKLLLAFGSILLLSMLMMLKAYDTVRTSDQYQMASEDIDGVSLDILEMDGALKYFISEGYKEASFQEARKSSHMNRYAHHLSEVRLKLAALKNNSVIMADSSTSAINKLLDHLNVQAQTLSGFLKERGFKDFGLEGDLRKAIHQVENSGFAYDKVDMLMLRRHEKDFFLRKDLKYRDEFNKKADVFALSIESSPPSLERDEILDYLKSYRSKFNLVVDIEEKIGLQKDGLKGVINHDLEIIKAKTTRLRETIKAEEASFQKISWTLLTLLFFVQFAAGIVMAIIYADQITKPVKQLQHAIGDFAKGSLPSKLAVRSTDEIGKTKNAFNQLIDRIKAAQDFSDALGHGKLESTYHQSFRDDLLARSLTRMQQQLTLAQESQKVINWNNSGAAQLNEILKAENEAIEILGDRIIKMLVTYVSANQGALFLTHGEGNALYAERISTYAYHKKRFTDQRIEAGQGTIGQCLLEKSTIVLKAVPSDYIRITSGLGEAVPRFIIIVPLLVRDEIMGIIEIASFETLEDYQIDFLEKISNNIASILANKKSAEDTRKLLEEARERAEELASQEEEIRQNAEEMQAITEQLEREKEMMMKEISDLKFTLYNSNAEQALSWRGESAMN